MLRRNLSMVGIVLSMLSHSTLSNGDDIPNVFFQSFGLMARPVWNSYQKDGKLDLRALAEDSMLQEFGGYFDAFDFAEIAGSLDQDPFEIMKECIESGEVRKQVFALNAVLVLHDRRFYEMARSLNSSEVSILREDHRIRVESTKLNDPFQSSGEPEIPLNTLGDLASLVTTELEKDAATTAMVISDQAWLVKAQSANIEKARVSQ